MPQLAMYGILALAILGTLGGMAYKVRESGFDACTVERDAKDAKAVAAAEAERQRQDALRQAQDKEATKRLANEKTRSRTLMASLEAHIRAAGSAAACPIPDGLRDAWNAANAGPEGVGPGTVPSERGKASDPR